MTVSTTTRKAGPFAGNGVTVAFPFVFKVFATSEVVVITSVAGVETTLVLGVDYSVTLNPDQDGTPGGSVTMVTAPAVGKTLVITSNVAATQLTLVTNGGGFFPKVFNGVFDKLTILVQQLAERVGRAFVVPITYAGSSVLPVVPSGVLQWASDGLSLTAVTLPDLSLILALPPQAGHANHSLFSNGVTAAWRATAISDVTGLQASLNYCVALAAAAPTQAQVRAAAADAATQAIASQAAFLLNAAVIF